MEPKQAEALLIDLLETSGVDWRRELGCIRIALTSGGMRWDVACRCDREGVLIYGRYPFSIELQKRNRGLELCSQINSRLLRGSLYLTGDGRPVYRSWADTRDPYTARENLARAVEENAAVIGRFWGRLAHL